MLTFVTCTTCGSPLSEIAAIFRAIRLDLVKEKLKETGAIPINLVYDTSEIEMEKIIDDLGVDLICCRTHLISAMYWTDYF